MLMIIFILFKDLFGQWYDCSWFVLFGATQSFVSLTLSEMFRDAPGTLDSSLEVEIADDHTMSVEFV